MNDEIETLRAALAALKEAKVLRAQLELGDLKLNVEFPMDLSGLADAAAVAAAGTPPTPGGWKGPSDLDAAFEDLK